MAQSELRIRLGIIFLCVVLFVIQQSKPGWFDILRKIKFDEFSIILLSIAGITIIYPYIGLWLKYISLINRRWILVGACLGLVLIRTFNPSTQVDTNSIWLIGIAALLFILPDLKSLAPYIKKIKVGEAELELKENIGNLEKEVEKAQNAINKEEGASILNFKNVSSDIEKIIEDSSRDPKAALLLLSAKIEQQLRTRLEVAGIKTDRIFSLSRYVEIGIKEGIFPQDFLPAFRDFASVRNRVAHGDYLDADDAYIISIVSLGTELLKVASTQKESTHK